MSRRERTAFVAQILAVVVAALAGALAGTWFDSITAAWIYPVVALLILILVILTSYAASRARHEDGQELSAGLESLQGKMESFRQEAEVLRAAQDETSRLREEIRALRAGLEKPQRRRWRCR